MTMTQELAGPTAEASATAAIDMKVEVLILPVADVDRAAAFYQGLGWRLDVDVAAGDGRIVHFTPPGSACSVMFGTGLTAAAPGSAQDNFLVVSDIVAAREALVRKGVMPSEVFHDRAGGHRFDAPSRAPGLDPERRSYASYLSFSDPEGNSWLVQEVTARFPGRIDPAMTCFASASDLAAAMRRAAEAHHDYELRTGVPDPAWPDWYAGFMVAEQSASQGAP